MTLNIFLSQQSAQSLCVCLFVCFATDPQQQQQLPRYLSLSGATGEMETTDRHTQAYGPPVSQFPFPFPLSHSIDGNSRGELISGAESEEPRGGAEGWEVDLTLV